MGTGMESLLQIPVRCHIDFGLVHRRLHQQARLVDHSCVFVIETMLKWLNFL